MRPFSGSSRRSRTRRCKGCGVECTAERCTPCKRAYRDKLGRDQATATALREVLEKTCDFCGTEKRHVEFHKSSTCLSCLAKIANASTYGLSRPDYAAMLRESSGRCKICKTNCDLVIDHCHATGRVRGLLCHHCNSLLGFARDNRATLLSAVGYLKKAVDGLE